MENQKQQQHTTVRLIDVVYRLYDKTIVPEFVFRISNGETIKRVSIDGCWDNYGTTDAVNIPNVLDFADWFKRNGLLFEDDTKFDQSWLFAMIGVYLKDHPYTGFDDANGTPINGGDQVTVKLERHTGMKESFTSYVHMEEFASPFANVIPTVDNHGEFFELDDLINYQEYLVEYDLSADDIVWAQVEVNNN